MKILVLTDHTGFFTQMKEAFQAMGHEVIQAPFAEHIIQYMEKHCPGALIIWPYMSMVSGVDGLKNVLRRAKKPPPFVILADQAVKNELDQLPEVTARHRLPTSANIEEILAAFAAQGLEL